MVVDLIYLLCVLCLGGGVFVSSLSCVKRCIKRVEVFNVLN